MEKLPTFNDLRLHFRTGRSILISGSGRDKKYSYRHGVMCNLGDMEESEWVQQVDALIRRSNEEELYRNLLHWCRDHNFARESENELRFRAYELHVARIFDDKRWVDYVPFNNKYRPGFIK